MRVADESIGFGRQSYCAERAKLWTDAHEYGATKPSGMSDAQFSADRQKDLLNNAAGREISESYYNKQETQIIEQTQFYTDMGYLIRIKTDAQINYTYSQMLAIPTWTLINTNTAGRI